MRRHRGHSPADAEALIFTRGTLTKSAGPTQYGLMTPNEVAQRLVELCRKGEYDAAQKELYSPDAESIEPDFVPDNVARGAEALAAKVKMWNECFEVHGGAVGDPVVAGPFIACSLSADITDRKTGKRTNMEELCVYEVKDGKIVREQFFYPPES